MSKTTYDVKISSQGQITLPAELFRTMNIKKGGRVRLQPDSPTQISVTSKLPIEKYLGTVDLYGRGIDLAKIIDHERDEQDKVSDKLFQK